MVSISDSNNLPPINPNNNDSITGEKVEKEKLMPSCIFDTDGKYGISVEEQINWIKSKFEDNEQLKFIKEHNLNFNFDEKLKGLKANLKELPQYTYKQFFELKNTLLKHVYNLNSEINNTFPFLVGGEILNKATELLKSVKKSSDEIPSEEKEDCRDSAEKNTPKFGC